MAKTSLTLDLEKELYNTTNRIGLVFCTEVSIGKGGKERVDAMTIDSKNIVRCYEIKVSKQDFYSKAKKSFCGHYNYYVMPKELFDVVSKDIDDYVGVYCKGYGIVKNPKKQKLKVDLDILKTSMMFALYREAVKGWKSENVEYVAMLKRQINYEKSKQDEYKEDLRNLKREIRVVKNWLRENNNSWSNIVDKEELL